VTLLDPKYIAFAFEGHEFSCYYDRDVEKVDEPCQICKRSEGEFTGGEFDNEAVVVTVEIAVESLTRNNREDIPLDSEQGKRVVQFVQEQLCHGKKICEYCLNNLANPFRK